MHRTSHIQLGNLKRCLNNDHLCVQNTTIHSEDIQGFCSIMEAEFKDCSRTLGHAFVVIKDHEIDTKLHYYKCRVCISTVYISTSTN